MKVNSLLGQHAGTAAEERSYIEALMHWDRHSQLGLPEPEQHHEQRAGK